MTTVKEAGLATIDMKLEVIVIPVSEGHRSPERRGQRDCRIMSLVVLTEFMLSAEDYDAELWKRCGWINRVPRERLATWREDDC